MTTHRSDASRPDQCSALSDSNCVVDWTSTALGAVENWSASLKTAAALVFAANHPMMLFWGADFLCVMNETARALRGIEPPVAPAEQAWPEMWAELRVELRAVGSGAPPISRDHCALPVAQPAGMADRRFSLTCSPVLDPAAGSGIGGVLVLLVERAPRFQPIASVAQAALVASEERLRLGLEAGRMVTWEFDLQTGQLSQSSNSEAIFGPGLRSEDYTARMPAEDLASDQERLQRALASPEGLYASEFHYNHPDGRLLFLQNWGQVMRDAGGAPIRVHGVCMDITDRKQAEDALVQLTETLEQQVEKRTEELQQAEEALHQAQKMEALGHLTGGVAHDFNNLLGSMVASFELIRRKHDDKARVRSLAESGLLVAERGAKLTSQLLTFSRAQHIELTPVDVAAIIDGMRDMLRRTLGPLITVDFDVRCGGRFVLSDATQLEMAVLNLAINARDAMLDGGRLTVAARLQTVDRDPTLGPGEYVELLVQDTGIGMSPEVAARAFDPFFTTKGIGKGTGLGLSQVYGIARQAGGAVRIDSQPGRGTSIRMLLPCTDALPAVERPTPPPPDRPVAPDATVLLVDDDQDLRFVLAASLQDLGYSVIEAADGREGLVLLEQHAPDLLVADFAMPGMTGAELARSARLLQPDLPIIFASGYADTLKLDVDAGPAPRVLRKPFRITELQAEIEEALSARG